MTSLTNVPGATAGPLPGSATTPAAVANNDTLPSVTKSTPTVAAAPNQALPANSSLTQEQLGKIITQLQSQMPSASSDLQFSVDQDTGQSVVKVMDKSTNSVVWQFPSDQALQMAKDLEKSQKGALVNQKA